MLFSKSFSTYGPIRSCYIPSYTMSCYFGLLEKLIKFLQLVKQGKERDRNTVIYSINCSRDVFFSSVILKKTYGPQIQCVIRPAVLCDIRSIVLRNIKSAMLRDIRTAVLLNIRLAVLPILGQLCCAMLGQLCC